MTWTGSVRLIVASPGGGGNMLQLQLIEPVVMCAMVKLHGFSHRRGRSSNHCGTDLDSYCGMTINHIPCFDRGIYIYRYIHTYIHTYIHGMAMMTTDSYHGMAMMTTEHIAGWEFSGFPQKAKYG